MASFSDNFNKSIAKGFNLYGQARAIGDALGLLGGRTEPQGLANQVVSEIRKNGISRSSLAFTEIIVPTTLRNFTQRKLDKGSYQSVAFLSFRNDSFSTPGLSMATSDVRRYGVGPTEKKPYGVVYQDVTYNYILDATNTQHKFFYKWMDSIVKHSYKNIEKADRLWRTGSPAYPYEVNYKSEYATRILIHSFDEKFDDATNNIDRAAQQVTLEQAFPVFIGDIQYNWAGVDQLIRLPVTFTYYRWHVKSITDLGELDTRQGSNLGLLGTLIKAGTAIQALSTLRSPRNIQDVVNVVNTTSVLRSF
jgi:hypothetical protein